MRRISAHSVVFNPSVPTDRFVTNNVADHELSKSPSRSEHAFSNNHVTICRYQTRYQTRKLSRCLFSRPESECDQKEDFSFLDCKPWTGYSIVLWKLFQGFDSLNLPLSK